MKPPALVVGARHAVPSLSFRREPEFGPATGGISIPRDAGLLDPVPRRTRDSPGGRSRLWRDRWDSP